LRDPSYGLWLILLSYSDVDFVQASNGDSNYDWISFITASL